MEQLNSEMKGTLTSLLQDCLRGQIDYDKYPSQVCTDGVPLCHDNDFDPCAGEGGRPYPRSYRRGNLVTNANIHLFEIYNIVSSIFCLVSVARFKPTA